MPATVCDFDRCTEKRPTWRSTLRCSTTSAYSLTSHPAPVPMRHSQGDRQRCPFFSHPTNSTDFFEQGDLHGMIRLATVIDPTNLFRDCNWSLVLLRLCNLLRQCRNHMMIERTANAKPVSPSPMHGLSKTRGRANLKSRDSTSSRTRVAIVQPRF